jgi:cytochrome c oxidase subunit 4
MNHNNSALDTTTVNEPTLGLYWVIYILLLLGLALTVGVAYVPLHGWNTPAALLVAFLKAMLVVLYFMHVRYGIRLTWLVAASGFVWLAILLTFTLSDYASRDWLQPIEGPQAYQYQPFEAENVVD